MDDAPAITRLKNNLAEIIGYEDLVRQLEAGAQITHYIGFEISGYVHIGTGLMASLVMKDLSELGIKCTVWLADYHSAINGKLDGKPETAAKVGKNYFTEAIKASYQAVGGNPDDLEFRLASETYQADYLDLVRRVGDNVTLSRVSRSLDIMGKQSGTEVAWSRTLYPVMQAADIFYQNFTIAHAGMDQRKVHVIARDVAHHIAPDQPKPIILHHPLLEPLSGKETGDKMSKSDPNSALLVHDTEDDIRDKIKRAFCSAQNVENNPILNWAKNILFWNPNRDFTIQRSSEHGGNIKFLSFESLQQAFAEGQIHPVDLKTAVADELVDLLAPVREHFAKPDISAKKEELDTILAKPA